MLLPRRGIRWATLTTAALGMLVATAGPALAATTVAQWNMSDTGSAMADSSGHGHTGTLHHVAVQQAGAPTPGFGFSGRPSYITVPASGDFAPGTGNFRFQLSVRFTARPSSSVGDYDLLRMGLSTTSGGDYKMEILQSGQAYCEFRGSSGTGGVSGGPALSDGRWHTLACTRTASSVVLTVDGASYATARRTGAITSAVTVYIGAKDSTGGDQYTGLMDSVSVSKG